MLFWSNFFGQNFADQVWEGNFAWIKIQRKLFLANFIKCRIKFATQFVKAGIYKHGSIVSKKSPRLCRRTFWCSHLCCNLLLHLVWSWECIPAAYERQIGGFLTTSRTKYMTGRPHRPMCGGQTNYPELPGSRFRERETRANRYFARRTVISCARKMISRSNFLRFLISNF